MIHSEESENSASGLPTWWNTAKSDHKSVVPWLVIDHERKARTDDPSARKDLRAISGMAFFKAKPKPVDENNEIWCFRAGVIYRFTNFRQLRLQLKIRIQGNDEIKLKRDKCIFRANGVILWYKGYEPIIIRQHMAGVAGLPLPIYKEGWSKKSIPVNLYVPGAGIRKLTSIASAGPIVSAAGRPSKGAFMAISSGSGFYIFRGGFVMWREGVTLPEEVIARIEEDPNVSEDEIAELKAQGVVK